MKMRNPPMRKAILTIALLAVLFTACDGIDLDATTRTEPTPPSGVWQVESDQHARRIEAKQTQEAR